METENLGRRTFFVCPPSVVQDQLIDVLIQAEFEVALVKSYQGIFPLILEYPTSLFFLNTEHPMPDKSRSWDWVIDQIHTSQKDRTVKIGVMGYNNSPELAQHYIMEKGVECGYIQLKLGLAQTAKILLKTLELNEARGRRKYIRVRTGGGKSTINIRTAGGFADGELLDVSSVGVAASMKDPTILLAQGEKLEDMQLRLWGTLVKVSGKIMGTRTQDNGSPIHVVMFDPPLDGVAKSKIHSFIRKVLQHETDSVIR